MFLTWTEKEFKQYCQGRRLDLQPPRRGCWNFFQIRVSLSKRLRIIGPRGQRSFITNFVMMAVTWTLTWTW